MSNARDTAKNLKTGLNVASFGNVVDIQKDGSTVGGISTFYGNPMFGKNSGARLAFDTSAIYSSNDAGSTADNVYALGGASSRFTDLYLSGGAYLGGTTAANKLDDYEEGTWTPDFAQGSISLHNNTAFYVKIGKLVTAYCRVANPTDVTNTGTVTLTGLPFTVNATNYDSNIGSVWGNKLGSANSFYIYAGSSSTSCTFYYGASGSSAYSPVRYNSLYSDTNMIMRFHYMST